MTLADERRTLREEKGNTSLLNECNYWMPIFFEEQEEMR